MALLITILVGIWYANKWWYLVISCIGALLFSAFLIYDLQVRGHLAFYLSKLVSTSICSCVGVSARPATYSFQCTKSCCKSLAGGALLTHALAHGLGFVIPFLILCLAIAC